MGVVGEFFVYLLKIPVGIFKEMFIEVFNTIFKQNIHPFLFRGGLQGRTINCSSALSILFFLSSLADVLAACHYHEKLFTSYMLPHHSVLLAASYRSYIPLRNIQGLHDRGLRYYIYRLARMQLSPVSVLAAFVYTSWRFRNPSSRSGDQPMPYKRESFFSVHLFRRR